MIRDRPAPIVAADRDAGAVRAAEANAERAGVPIDLRVGAASALELPPGPGLVLTNPPYGGRLAGDPRDLYAALGALARRHDWELGVLTNQARLAAATGAGLRERLRTTNGGLPVALYTSAGYRRPA
jgi:putative N6-adenine-specific DNA methylase